MKTKTKDKIKSADAFTVMADTTPDVSHKGHMSVICRYVNERGVPCEPLIDLKDVRDKTDAGQATAIISSVNSPGLY